MDDQLRLTWPLLRVLKVLCEQRIARHYGFELCKTTKLSSGTVYPLLLRLEQAGWLDSAWEDVDPKAAKRPRRRFYRLTGEGARHARAALLQAQQTMAWDGPTELPAPGGNPA